MLMLLLLLMLMLMLMLGLKLFIVKSFSCDECQPCWARFQSTVQGVAASNTAHVIARAEERALLCFYINSRLRVCYGRKAVSGLWVVSWVR